MRGLNCVKTAWHCLALLYYIGLRIVGLSDRARGCFDVGSIGPISTELKSVAMGRRAISWLGSIRLGTVRGKFV